MILILGAKGQVGGALARILGKECITRDRSQLDLSLPENFIRKQLDTISPAPGVLINAAAYTQVDKAENEQNLAFALNTGVPGVLAGWCRERGIPFVHYSTDYVFNGSSNTPYTEEDPPHPLSVYGQSKRLGEEAVTVAGGKHLIFRTSWVYDETGKNFLNTMLKLGHEREELRVVNDQHGAPTYAGNLAEATLKVLSAARAMPQFPSGIYHLCNAGETTWNGFASTIFMLAETYGDAIAVQHVVPISTAEYPTPAARPANSRLCCEKAKRVFGVTLPPWHEGLNACMKRRYAHLIHTA